MKKMKKAISLILTIALILTVCAPGAYADGAENKPTTTSTNGVLFDGDGTENYPIEIDTAQKLYEIRNITSWGAKSYILTKDINLNDLWNDNAFFSAHSSEFSLGTFNPATNTTNGAINWVPLPCKSGTPTGNTGLQSGFHFNGANYEIQNMTINRASTQQLAFFGGQIQASTAGEILIENVIMRNVQVISNMGDVGALLAQVNFNNNKAKLTIRNCHVTGTPASGSTAEVRSKLVGMSGVGGLIGRVESKEDINILDCSAILTDVNPAGTNKTNVRGQGGLIGTYGATGTIKNCIVKDVNVLGVQAVGGLVGYLSALTNNVNNSQNLSEMSNCQIENTTITSIAGGDDQALSFLGVGGFAGYSENGLYFAKKISNITVKQNRILGFGKIGGLIGFAMKSSASGREFTINDCQVESSMIKAISGGTLETPDLTFPTSGANLSKCGEMGGFIGLNETAKILNSQVCDTSLDGLYKIGGFVGNNCKDGSISLSKVLGGNLKGIDNIGGFVGINEGTTTAAIDTSYTTAKPIETSTAGAFTGGGSGNYHSCYYLEGAFAKGSSGIDQNGYAEEISFAITSSAIKLKTNEILTLELTKTLSDVSYTPQNIIWSVNENGQITSSTTTGAVIKALKAGTITVTANIDGIEKRIDITAEQAPVTYGLTSSAIKVNTGETLTIELTKTPADATSNPLSVNWSANENGQITSSTTTGAVIKALKAGTIIVTANIDGIEKNIEITAEQAPVTFGLTSSAIKVNTGETLTIELTKTPADATSNPLSVNWSVNENGQITSSTTTGALIKALKAGTITVTANIDGIEKSITITAEQAPTSNPDNGTPPNPSSGGGGGGGGGGGTTPSNATPTTSTSGGKTTVSTTANANTSASGKATATVTEAQLKETIEKAVMEAKKQGADSVVEIKVTAPKTATTVETTVQGKSISNLTESKITALTVTTPLSNLTFDETAIGKIKDQVSADVKMAISIIDNQSLSTEAKAVVGDRTVLDISIISNNQKVTDFGKGKLKISIPYTLKSGEKAENVVAYYINNAGKPEKMVDAKYNPETKEIVFTTNHLSVYAVGYEEKIASKFSDVEANAWYANYVYTLVNKGVIKGKTETTFAPKDTITRAEFVTMLANMAGAKPTGSKATFKDVAEKAWYKDAATWAAETGIAKGFNDKGGDLIFNPNGKITRQDMAVMIQRYADNVAKYKITGSNSAMAFSDDIQIASYAKDAVLKMQQAGIIAGRDDGKFAPLDYANRGEAAKMIAIFIQQTGN